MAQRCSARRPQARGHPGRGRHDRDLARGRGRHRDERRPRRVGTACRARYFADAGRCTGYRPYRAGRGDPDRVRAPLHRVGAGRLGNRRSGGRISRAVRHHRDRGARRTARRDGAHRGGLRRRRHRTVAHRRAGCVGGRRVPPARTVLTTGPNRARRRHGVSVRPNPPSHARPPRARARATGRAAPRTAARPSPACR